MPFAAAKGIFFVGGGPGSSGSLPSPTPPSQPFEFRLKLRPKGHNLGPD